MSICSCIDREIGRRTNGKIVEDDPITTPELTQELGPLIAPARV